MVDAVEEIFKEPEIKEGGQPLRSYKKNGSGRFYNFLAGIFMAGTFVAGMLFTIIFMNPQSRLNPLPPITMSSSDITYAASSTPKPALPPTWTPTISPTEAPTLVPKYTNTPTSIVYISTAPAADPENGDNSGEENDIPAHETEHVDAITACNWQGGAGQIYDMDGIPITSQLASQSGQPRVASVAADPIPTEQSLIEDLPQDMGISDLFTPEVHYWEDEILAWAEEFGLDPNLIATVMQIESCGYTRAKSAAGAMGLFQVMPHHFKKKEDPYDPDTNAFRGLSWLQKTVRSGGSTTMALAGYNAGIARINNPYLEWPNETLRYVNWGVNIYQDSVCGYETSSALQHWLSKGGSALCDRAAAEQLDQ